MKASTTLVHLLGAGSLVLQLILIAFTAWFLPTRLPTRRFGLLIFVIGVPLLWFAFSIFAMLLDGLDGNGVPGIGYLLEGLMPGVIGFCIYVSRWQKRRG